MTITLTWFEVFSGAMSGVLRQIENRKQGRPDGFPGDDSWGVDINGALAEMAVAKALDRYWKPVSSGHPKLLPGDVGELQIRSTLRTNGCLIVHHRDPDEATFILVVGSAPTFTIVGSITGREAKNPEWWREDTGRPAFFVPQEALQAA